LDGRAATTHPDRADQLRREFPGLRVETGVAFVDHGDVATSAGAGAGLELFLHLVRRDLGAGPARRLARHMAMPAGRIDPAPALRPADEGLERLLSWAEPRLGDPLRASELAAQLNVSSRTLARRFAEHVGTTPGAWLLERRLAAAQALLERTDLPVEAVAARVGLGSAVNLRRRFRAHLGRTPAQYRRESRSPAAAVARR
jgi:AraC family transcriptional activator FtrA